MKISLINCRSLLNRSKLSRINFTLNPYLGCFHRCLYCYVPCFFQSLGKKCDQELKVKINAPQILSKELKRIKRGSIFISSSTDPYGPQEKKYQITRQCLVELLNFPGKIILLTKSPLVLRDLDLLKKIKNLEVGFSLSTLNEKIRKIFEPNASPIKERIFALKSLKKARVKIYVFVAPLLPYFTERKENLLPLFKELEKVNPSYLLIDRLNYQKFLEKKKEFRELFQKNHPFKKAFLDSQKKGYPLKLKRELKKILRNFSFTYQILF